MKIMTVETSDRVTNLLQSWSDRHGHAIEAVTSENLLRQGVAVTAASDCDLVVIGHLLPRQTAVRLCQQLRASGNLTTILLIIEVNEQADPSLTAIEAGADDYFTKPSNAPIDLEALLVRVTFLLYRNSTLAECFVTLAAQQEAPEQLEAKKQQPFTGRDRFIKNVSDRQQTAFKLQQQLERERLIAEITDSIRQTLDLDQILHTAVDQVRRLLQTDRVIIFRFLPNWQGIVEAESVAAGWTKTLGMKLEDSCFDQLYTQRYKEGRVSAIADINTEALNPCHVELLSNFQVQANLVVPILQGSVLWGLLIAHHCRQPRHWEVENTQLLQQVATQIGIAIRQAELYRKTREQAALIDIATDAIFVRDLAGRIVLWSQGAERLYGWKKEEAIGKEAYRLLKKKSELGLDEIFRLTLEQGFWQGEMTQTTKAGREILVASRWTLVKDRGGRPQSLLEVNTDITEKKRLEAQFYQAQRLESLGRLASGIAHDLNNILTPILGIAQLLRLTQKDADAATHGHIDILEQSARRGTSMVKQILTFAQGNPGNRTPVDVLVLLQEVIDVVRQGTPSNIEIRLGTSDYQTLAPLRNTVFADATHLHQVFMNLCINACDAMPEGGVLRLLVSNASLDEATASQYHASAGDYVVITVADTGIGITPEVRDRMFDPFFTTKSPNKGTGLGLATVLGIVKSSGGFLRVNSDVNQGTHIRVYLPCRQVL
ncbi:GAF domain-containing protein [cf. Phormidesmis sp. LEGE 11477]|uniref:GAF domain-containing protein n=1 Tax=cf. Phormidesmis sp. LEGE 11477 TaxID=1828680 RepID=UPI001881EE6C|nr:GAF domain-containing protein [cf. Phormidesmis sp. LEGE 11477]MBE9062111.1 GAF domain-containing protein [cf. Phormidesmis sp. LEGE 11477]